MLNPRRILTGLVRLGQIILAYIFLVVLYGVLTFYIPLPVGPEVLVVLAVMLPVYFLPTLIGWRKRNVRAIFVLNLLLGWTLLGWVGALIWALTQDPPTAST